MSVLVATNYSCNAQIPHSVDRFHRQNRTESFRSLRFLWVSDLSNVAKHRSDLTSAAVQWQPRARKRRDKLLSADGSGQSKLWRGSSVRQADPCILPPVSAGELGMPKATNDLGRLAKDLKALAGGTEVCLKAWCLGSNHSLLNSSKKSLLDDF